MLVELFRELGFAATLLPARPIQILCQLLIKKLPPTAKCTDRYAKNTPEPEGGVGVGSERNHVIDGLIDCSFRRVLVRVEIELHPGSGAELNQSNQVHVGTDVHSADQTIYEFLHLRPRLDCRVLGYAPRRVYQEPNVSILTPCKRASQTIQSVNQINHVNY